MFLIGCVNKVHVEDVNSLYGDYASDTNLELLSVMQGRYIIYANSSKNDIITSGTYELDDIDGDQALSIHNASMDYDGIKTCHFKEAKAIMPLYLKSYRGKLSVEVYCDELNIITYTRIDSGT